MNPNTEGALRGFQSLGARAKVKDENVVGETGGRGRERKETGGGEEGWVEVNMGGFSAECYNLV